MAFPASFAWFLLREVGPRLWDAIVEGREPQFITLEQLASQARLNEMRRLAAKERARRRLGIPADPGGPG